MAITDKQTLKNWFITGAMPTQEQFAAWLDSYSHKNEQIPVGQVGGLQEMLDQFVADITAIVDEGVSLPIQMSDVSGLPEELDGKADKSDLENIVGGMINKGEVPTIIALPAIAEKGWAYIVIAEKDLVSGLSYIYQYDGVLWNNTKLTAFPADVQVKANKSDTVTNDAIKYPSNAAVFNEFKKQVKRPVRLLGSTETLCFKFSQNTIYIPAGIIIGVDGLAFKFTVEQTLDISAISSYLTLFYNYTLNIFEAQAQQGTRYNDPDVYVAATYRHASLDVNVDAKCVDLDGIIRYDTVRVANYNVLQNVPQYPNQYQKNVENCVVGAIVEYDNTISTVHRYQINSIRKTGQIVVIYDETLTTAGLATAWIDINSTQKKCVLITKYGDTITLIVDYDKITDFGTPGDIGCWISFFNYTPSQKEVSKDIDALNTKVARLTALEIQPTTKKTDFFFNVTTKAWQPSGGYDSYIFPYSEVGEYLVTATTNTNMSALITILNASDVYLAHFEPGKGTLTSYADFLLDIPAIAGASKIVVTSTKNTPVKLKTAERQDRYDTIAGIPSAENLNITIYESKPQYFFNGTAWQQSANYNSKIVPVVAGKTFEVTLGTNAAIGYNIYVTNSKGIILLSTAKGGSAVKEETIRVIMPKDAAFMYVASHVTIESIINLIVNVSAIQADYVDRYNEYRSFTNRKNKSYCNIGASTSGMAWHSDAVKLLSMTWRTFNVGGCSARAYKGTGVAGFDNSVLDYSATPITANNVLMNQVARLYKANTDEGYYPDNITILCGLNDVSYNIAYNGGNFGTVDNAMSANFTGLTPENWLSTAPNSYVNSSATSTRAAFEFLTKKFPLAQIILFTPHGVDTPSYTYTGVKAISAIQKEIAQLYAIPIIDFLNECGISPYNSSVFLNADKLHPNSAGIVVMREFAALKLANLLHLRK